MIPTKWILIVACVLICISALVTPVCIHLVLAKLERVEVALNERKVVQVTTLVTKYPSELGEQIVTTSRNPGEEASEHSARHKVAVLAHQVEFPKV